MILQHFVEYILDGNVAKCEWNEIGPARWKIPFHSTYENFGNLKRNFWSNGTHPGAGRFHYGKFCSIRPRKSPEIHTEIFGRMERA